ncbi:hypothetical protein C8R47DRAFT_704893 [Mycena vitilis]|nr:hypothetical protein C8R47DRAFT_704893 [Mycena vitilis]
MSLASSCIMDDPKFMCQAAHLIPHSKPDSYLAAVNNQRYDLSRDPECGTRVDEIDSPLNGFLLSGSLHILMKSGFIGFLHLSPKGILRPEDVENLDPPATQPSSRVVFQHLINIPGPLLWQQGTTATSGLNSHLWLTDTLRESLGEVSPLFDEVLYTRRRGLGRGSDSADRVTGGSRARIMRRGDGSEIGDRRSTIGDRR